MVNGNHWSCAYINLETADGKYTDSKGREVPRDFKNTFSKFFQAICKVYKKSHDFIKSMQVAHEIQSIKSVHKVNIFV